MFIFFDESGNFTKDKDDYFIIGGFITNNPKRTAKAFRKWQHTKFPKKLRRKNEVKFTDTGLDDKLRLKTINYFIKQDIRIFYTFLKKSNIPLKYRKEKSIDTGFLYAEVAAKTISLLLPTTDLNFYIIRDNRQLKKLTRARFNEIIKLDLMPNLSASALLKIKAVDSSINPNIQIADWICGALFRYYNKRKNGDFYYSIFENSIIKSKELFENYWEEVFKNKKPPQKR